MMHGKAKKGEPFGPGGLAPAMTRNPNDYTDVNDAPCGPYSHFMGYEGDGGMHGGETVSGKHGGKFHFK